MQRLFPGCLREKLKASSKRSIIDSSGDNPKFMRWYEGDTQEGYVGRYLIDRLNNWKSTVDRLCREVAIISNDNADSAYINRLESSTLPAVYARMSEEIA